MKGMEDYRDLDLWKSARCLTLAAFQFTHVVPTHRRAGDIVSRIRERCIELLTLIQRFEEETIDNVPMHEADLMNDLCSLLADAHHRGIIGTLEFSLLVREVVSVKNAFGSVAVLSMS
jgi:hypothetical protein